VKALRALAANVLAPVGIAVALFFVLEGGCRVAGRLRTGEWPRTRAEGYTAFVRGLGAAYQAHPYLVVCGRPNAVLRAAGKEIRFNARGERGTNLLDLPVPKPAGTFRILCAGGSATYDLLAKDNAATWPARLGALLAPKGVDVANAGFSGWTSLESLVSLHLRGLELSPDLVVVLSGVNDLQPAGHVPFSRDYRLGHADLLPRVTGVVPVPLRLTSRSLLVESLLDRLRPSRGVDAEGFAPAYEWTGGAPKDDIPDAAVAVYERNLRSTAAVAAAGGAKVLLLPQTIRIRADRAAADEAYVRSWAPGLSVEGFRKGLARYGGVARRLGEEGAALFFDPFSAGGFTDADFDDPFHFSAAGSEKLARSLAERVSGRLLPGAASPAR